jgi:hypothetical protein
MTKLIALGFLTTLTILNSQAQEQQPEELILRVQSGAVSGTILAIAKTEAARILGRAGVHVQWKSFQDPRRAQRQIRECSTPAPDVSDIDILIQDVTWRDDHPGALGYAVPFAKSGFRVVIFWDRILAATERPNAKLLGHVIAHETGHMLMGTLSHAARGVMKAHWSAFETSTMQSHSFSFVPADVEMIARRFEQQRISCSELGTLVSLLRSR